MMNVANDLFSATMTEHPARAPQSQALAPKPIPHRTAIESLGNAMTDSARDSLLASAQEFKQSGASFEEVKSFVNSKLDTSSANVSSNVQSTGNLVDMYA